MQELRLVAVSEDGSYAVLVVPGRSGRFALPIDERLRTVARGQFSRLAQYEIEVESPLRPKEIQDRIRAGETAEEIADAAGLPVDRIRRFEGPVLAEREFRATEAQRATVRGPAEAGIGPRLSEVVTERLSEIGASPEDAEWDSRKRQDGNWQVQLAYTIGGRMYVAEWIYDPRGKHVTPGDDEAARLSLDEAYWPGPRNTGTAGGTATVTPIGSRTASTVPSVSQPTHPSRPSHPSQPSEYRPSADRAGGTRGLSHPSRQAPTSVTAAAAGPPQPPTQVSHGSRADLAGPGVDATGPDAADHPEQPAEPEIAQQAQDRDAEPAPRPARRATGARARRSSVPSWDEIMFGNSRQPD